MPQELYLSILAKPIKSADDLAYLTKFEGKWEAKPKPVVEEVIEEPKKTKSKKED